MISLKVGQVVYAVTAVGKKRITITEGVVLKIPDDKKSYLDVEFKRKNPVPGYSDKETQCLWLNDQQITENDQPWRSTREEALRYMRDKKLSSLERLKRSMGTVEANISLLTNALVEIRENKE